jgi:hypothetical protein
LLIVRVSQESENDLGADGLRVSAKKGHAETEASINSQENFDFPGYFPTSMVQ